MNDTLSITWKEYYGLHKKADMAMDSMADAKCRIEELEWLVEVLEEYMSQYAVDADNATETDHNAYEEIVASCLAARAAAGV